MKRSFVKLLFLFSAVLPMCVPAASGWIRYSSTEGRYSILLPHEPKLSDHNTIGPAGESIQQHIAVTLDSNGISYMVAYFDIPHGITYSFKEAQDGMIGAAKGMLLREKALNFQGNPAREFEALFKISDDREYIVVVRSLQAGTRIFLMQIVFPNSEREEVVHTKSKKYFNSLRFTQSL